jgi:hypothetical protein
MLDALFSSVKGELMVELGSKFNLDSSQGEKVAKVTKESVKSALSKELASGNVGDNLQLLNGVASIKSNPIVSNAVGNLVSSLMSKVGLSSTMATSISNYVVPFVLNKIAAKKPSDGFDISSLTELISGSENGLGDSSEPALGDSIANKFGKLFG